MPPEVAVELLQAEIVHFLHVMEETLLQDTNSVLDGALVFRLLYLGRQDNGVVVFSPFCVIPVQFRRNPVSVCNNGLLAVVADDERWYAPRNTEEHCC